jgi:hypothetical protein
MQVMGEVSDAQLVISIARIWRGCLGRGLPAGGFGRSFFSDDGGRDDLTRGLPMSYAVEVTRVEVA